MAACKVGWGGHQATRAERRWRLVIGWLRQLAEGLLVRDFVNEIAVPPLRKALADKHCRSCQWACAAWMMLATRRP